MDGYFLPYTCITHLVILLTIGNEVHVCKRPFLDRLSTRKWKLQHRLRSGCNGFNIDPFQISYLLLAEGLPYRDIALQKHWRQPTWSHFTDKKAGCGTTHFGC